MPDTDYPDYTSWDHVSRGVTLSQVKKWQLLSREISVLGRVSLAGPLLSRLLPGDATWTSSQARLIKDLSNGFRSRVDQLDRARRIDRLA